MVILFFTILFIAWIFGLLIYRFNGKKKLFSFDLVQFIYLFVIAPMIFLWLKSFSFFILRQEIFASLSLFEYFVIDAFFSVLGLYLYGILAIHSITKVFSLEKRRDPFIDIYRVSEYFHLWWTHLILFNGGFFMLSLFSLLNLIYPLPVTIFESQRWLVVLGGVIFGMLTYATVWSADPVQQKRSFLRLMKLSFIIFFLIQSFLYFLISPTVTIEYGIFWFVFFTFFTTVLCVMVVHRSERSFRLHNFLVHPGWGDNIDIFTTTGKGRTV